VAQNQNDPDKTERLIGALIDEAIPSKLKAKMLLWFFLMTEDEESKQDAFVKWADKIEPYMGSLNGELRDSYNRLAERLGLTPIQEKGRVKPSLTPTPKTARRRVMPVYTRIAAVLLPIMMVSSGWFIYKELMTERTAEPTEQIATILHSEQTQLAWLPDSTHVAVSPGSTARYVETDSERHVDLSGEAFFKVTSSDAKPFVVSSDNLQLKVLGTHFNVSDYPDEAQSEVSLFEGSVHVTMGAVENILSSGERLTYDRTSGNVSISIIPASEMIAGGYKPRLKFDHATLGEVLDALSAYHGTMVEIATEMDRSAGDLTVDLEGLSLTQARELLIKITETGQER
jgi:ferric-dicitrate binding protein FerR (iron transport regulator)